MEFELYKFFMIEFEIGIISEIEKFLRCHSCCGNFMIVIWSSKEVSCEKVFFALEHLLNSRTSEFNLFCPGV
uniref:Putative ovule protein n=1 Tax=Solanum chacoense TaxID=4108 RepID=A0A0V0IYS3_SOLCH